MQFSKKILIFYFCIFLSFYYSNLSYALQTDDLSLEKTKKLLEKGLTIFEIDQELERLGIKEEEIEQAISVTETNIVTQNKMVERSREKSGEVLKKYYTKERDDLIHLLFSSESISEVLSILEFMQAIVSRDQKILSDFQNDLDKLQALYLELLDTQTELSNIKKALIFEKERLITLQNELDNEIEQLEDGESILEQIEQLTMAWEHEGLPIFKTYFQALANAMQNLPDILTDNKQHLQLEGLQFVFQITDDELNEFLRKQDPLFEPFQFEFKKDEIVAYGTNKEINIKLSGMYQIVVEPENIIQFQVNELKYNDFLLPDTTIRALEEEFDLAFYPKKIAPFVEAKEIDLSEGNLKIFLNLLN
ncbi:coiled-coil domain-containing protein [Chengkuizengella sp. SCS-71B]|uniref:coiled-coil domain-containing protein n=1 Tax=Chengkuizengella sp. SCS-71B TaxID=3115290 RepID=UPI0032C23FC6